MKLKSGKVAALRCDAGSINPVLRHYIFLLLLIITGALFASDAAAAIVYRGNATGANTALPTNGTPGALTITRPAVAKPGMALIVSIAARPSQMTWVDPPGWTSLSIPAIQTAGGVSTAPGGMEMRTYYRIVGTTEPVSYTWTFANPQNQGGSAVGGMLVFSGIDTSANPIDGTPSSLLKAYDSSLIHRTTAITTLTNEAMVIPVISYLSAGSFIYSGTSCGTVEALDVSAPATANAIGTTLQMGYFTQSVAGLTCAPQSTASGSADSGVGHLLALRPSPRDLSLDMTRNVPLSQGGTASYTLTANNEGGLTEPGPLAVVNTLPTGLSLASYSGTGWSCSTAGQIVTCARAGVLAGGASAPPLVLNVNVSPTASGVLTNSATVSGTGGDGNSSNDTATDTYVILPSALAYYALDEGSGATSFANASGGANAVALGTATAQGNPPPTVGAAIAGNPGTCGAVRVPVGTTAIGISTGIDVNATIGNAGTIAFWYAGSTDWNNGTARMLFDASNELGNGGADKHFFLVKDGSGILRFALEDSADLDSTAVSASYNYAANTWHHIAVTWDLAADRLYIYLDGDTNPIATSTTNVNGTLGDMASLYLGAQRYTTIVGTPTGYTNNTANGYIDEVRIYNRALAPLEIEAVAALSHACAATVDHFELSMPSTSSACAPVTVTVTACADTSSPCSNRQAAAGGKTAVLATSAGTLASTLVTFDAIGVANTNLNYLAAATGASAAVTLSGETLPAGQVAVFGPRKCCPDGINCVVANSCTTTFTACSVPAANFNIVDSYYADKGYDGAADHRIYTKLAGWNEVTGSNGNTTFRLDLVALKSGGTTETGYVGAGAPSKNVTLQIIDDSVGAACNGSAAACQTCSKPVVATLNPVSFAAADLGYKNDASVSLGNSNAYPRLIVRVVDSNAAPTVYGCSSDAFAVRPQTFTVTATTAGGVAMTGSASGATGLPTVKAGTPFAMAADTGTPGYAGTPAIDAARVSDFLGSPTANLLAGSFDPADANGKASGTAFRYNEVGYVALATDAIFDAGFAVVDAGDCVSGSAANSKTNGKYGCVIGSAGTSWGRFVPDHFDTEVTAATGTFTYSGQPFTVKVTARNAAGGTTRNYQGTYAKAVSLTDANSATNNSSTLGAFSNVTLAASNFSNGEASATNVAYTFTNKETAPLEFPTSAPLKLRATVTDGSLTISSNGFTEGTAPIRAGRLRLINFYGSELLKPRVEYRVEYWNGSGWATNTLDSTTALVVGNIVNGGLAVTTLNALNAGVGFITFNTVGVGSYDIAINLNAAGVDTSCNPGHGGTAGNKPWLQGFWAPKASCNNTDPWNQDPSARVRLGSPKAPYIYLRERY